MYYFICVSHGPFCEWLSQSEQFSKFQVLHRNIESRPSWREYQTAESQKSAKPVLVVFIIGEMWNDLLLMTVVTDGPTGGMFRVRFSNDTSLYANLCIIY